jgi:DNA repair protein RadC
MKTKKIKEGPREKLLSKGAKSLRDNELIAVLLGSGTKDYDVFTLARKIVKTLDNQKIGEVRLETLQKIDGLGPAKAASILAAIEFVRRRVRPEGIKITFPTDILPLIKHYEDRNQEHFICVSLNGANEVIKIRVVTVGLVNSTQVHPREIFAEPITDRATCIIVAHNHPSGQLKPSNEDIKITEKLKDAGEVLGIKLLDHIIFNKKGYYSFLENNQI